MDATAAEIVARGLWDLTKGERRVEYFSRSWPVTYITNACYFLLIWDWILMSREEWNLIYRKKLSVASGLYIALRWFTFLWQSFEIISMLQRYESLDFCKAFWWMVAIATIVDVFFVQLILQGRVYAIYGRKRIILFGNFFLFLASLISIGVVFAQFLPTMTYVLVPKPLTGCWGGFPKEIGRAFIGPCVFEVWMWLMVCYKAYQNVTAFERAEGRSMRSGETLMYVLVRDSFMWFTAAAALMISNIGVWTLAGNGYNYLMIPVLQTGSCIGGCRLILNIRAAYFAEQERTTGNIGDESFRAAPMPHLLMETTIPEGQTFDRHTSFVDTQFEADEKSSHGEEEKEERDDGRALPPGDEEAQWTLPPPIDTRSIGRSSGSQSVPSTPTTSVSRV